ncbi:hypothetical protein AVEN_32304-1 [Araneus ventricosus]|uniref:Uncharacterized protein n=1 Tax=Araneus ventricosus TaxID=182803 RepID=A0A4Y2SDV2_ARAVE|nr:hypothetical protein AVEN_32304-1 [Araneus ventricosus]
MWCALSHDEVIGPFFFAETSVTENIYLDMLQLHAIPQMQHLQPTVTFQQDAVARMFEHFAGTGLPVGYPRIYNPLISSNKMLWHGCSSTLLEQDYRLDILVFTTH